MRNRVTSARGADLIAPFEPSLLAAERIDRRPGRAYRKRPAAEHHAGHQGGCARGSSKPDSAPSRRRHELTSMRPPVAVDAVVPISGNFHGKHASGLNMVEIEIGVLVKQCLDRRIADRHTLRRELASWQRRRNAQGARVKWLFDVRRARKRLARVYPTPLSNELAHAAPKPSRPLCRGTSARTPGSGRFRSRQPGRHLPTT